MIKEICNSYSKLKFLSNFQLTFHSRQYFKNLRNMTSTDTNRANQGFTNCPETPNPISLSVKGQIPDWIQGVLFRIGPGTFTIPSKKNKDNVFVFSHWFDGLSQVHRFEIKNGGVAYKSLNIAKGDERRIAESEGLPPGYFTFGQDICENMFKKFFTTFQIMTGTNYNNISDPYNVNINVTLHPWLSPPSTNDSTSATKSHRSIIAQTDYNMLKEIDAVTLEPIQNFSFKKYDEKFHGPLSPAHPQYDIETGEYISFVGDWGSRTEYNVFSIKRDPQSEKSVTTILATIPGKPNYIHSFSLTKKYVILILWPLEYANGLKMLWNRNLIQAMKPWDPNEKTLFHVIDRSARKLVATYTSSAFFCFHTLNAWDEDDDIVIDLVQYEDSNIIKSLSMETLLSDRETSIPNSTFHRYRLAKISQQDKSMNVNEVEKLPKAELVFNVPDELNAELATIDYSRYHLKKHRYAYGVSNSGKSQIQFIDQLIKLDLDRNSDGTFSHKIWQQHGCVPSEPIFIPSPNAKAEDDGAITSVVLNSNTGTSFLLILNASTFTEIARAEMEPGKFVPYGFHGLWDNTLA